MTVGEMHIRFKLKLDKTESLNNPSFEPEEIDEWLNIAQDRIIKQRYGGLNVHRTGFETTQKRTDDLRELLKEEILLANGVANYLERTRFQLPEDYWFSVSELLEVRYEDECDGNQVKTKRVQVKAIQHDDLTRMIEDPFWKPDGKTFLRVMFQDDIEIIGDGVVIPINLYLRYIKRPQAISLDQSQDCELAEHLHEEIVSEAATLALNNIGDPRTQLMFNDTQSQE